MSARIKHVRKSKVTKSDRKLLIALNPGQLSQHSLLKLHKPRLRTNNRAIRIKTGYYPGKPLIPPRKTKLIRSGLQLTRMTPGRVDLL